MHMKISYRQRIVIKEIKRLIMVLAASALMAVNIKSFVRAGDLIPGGFTGLTILIQQIGLQFWEVVIPFAPVNLMLNAIPAAISFKLIGKKFTIYSCIMIIMTSVLTDILPAYPLTYDILLISIFGGLVNGTAISMCLMADATSGGTDFIAIFLSEKFGIDSWNYILLGNAAVITAAGFIFGWNIALYSIIFQFTSTEMLHVCYKRYKRNTLLIITDQPEKVVRVIYHITGHGATNITGIGTHEKRERTLVYSVVASDEVKRVVSKLKKVDENVFVNVVKTEQLAGKFYQRPNS